jgi:peptidoglycan/xylan/chitin deacetylase (PgdA/CDA1 family)
MTLRALASAARRTVLGSFHRRMVPIGDHGPVVSFTFDDFPRTAYSVAGRILESFGVRGTYYVAPHLMGTQTDVGEICNAEDLRLVLEKGHELGTQTLHHFSARALSPQAFREDVEQGILEAEQVAGRPARNFSYPYGHVTLGTKKHLDSVVASARSIFPGINGAQINGAKINGAQINRAKINRAKINGSKIGSKTGPEIDLNLLRANRLYGDMSGASQVEQLIQQNVAQKGWLIFYTHDVEPKPSQYGCTPELIEFAVSTAARSGSRILTIEQFLSEIAGGTPARGAEVENGTAAIR